MSLPSLDSVSTNMFLGITSSGLLPSPALMILCFLWLTALLLWSYTVTVTFIYTVLLGNT